jgi:phosphoglycolate phosphatase
MPNVICFDLDGTLTDPAEGIVRSIQYACRELERPVPAYDELLYAIGPPIQQTFAALLQTDNQAQIAAAVQLYRDRYAMQGMLLENIVYPGIPEMLQRLTEAGKRLLVATSKPTVYAARIVEHFRLNGYFAHVYGSELDGARADKADLLAHILHREQLVAASVVMVGDRKHDIIGARQNGIGAVGVTYGYGSVDELTEAGADALCHTPDEVARLFCASQLNRIISNK